jgi:hypothetical protein
MILEDLYKISSVEKWSGSKQHPFKDLIEEAHVEANLMRQAAGLPPIDFKDRETTRSPEEIAIGLMKVDKADTPRRIAERCLLEGMTAKEVCYVSGLHKATVYRIKRELFKRKKAA